MSYAYCVNIVLHNVGIGAETGDSAKQDDHAPHIP